VELLPTFLKEQILNSNSRKKKNRFSAKEGIFIFFFLCLRKLIQKESFDSNISYFFNIGRSFMLQYLPIFFEKFQYLFEIIFVFEFLLKNFKKISNDNFDLFGSKLVYSSNENLKYCSKLETTNKSVISEIKVSNNSFSMYGSDLHKINQNINPDNGKFTIS
jgi:hypothetical protein